jgi:hypothetical protein
MARTTQRDVMRNLNRRFDGTTIRLEWDWDFNGDLVSRFANR